MNNKFIELSFTKEQIDNFDKHLTKPNYKNLICISSDTWNKLRIKEYQNEQN